MEQLLSKHSLNIISFSCPHCPTRSSERFSEGGAQTTAPASPGSLLEMHVLRPGPHLLDPNLEEGEPSAFQHFSR